MKAGEERLKRMTSAWLLTGRQIDYDLFLTGPNEEQSLQIRLALDEQAQRCGAELVPGLKEVLLQLPKAIRFGRVRVLAEAFFHEDGEVAVQAEWIFPIEKVNQTTSTIKEG
jgi:hypothetical protein